MDGEWVEEVALLNRPGRSHFQYNLASARLSQYFRLIHLGRIYFLIERVPSPPRHHQCQWWRIRSHFQVSNRPSVAMLSSELHITLVFR